MPLAYCNNSEWVSKLKPMWARISLPVTNSVRFDPTCAGTSTSSYGAGCGNTLSASSFGKLTTQLGTPRQMQLAGRYTW